MELSIEWYVDIAACGVDSHSCARDLYSQQSQLLVSMRSYLAP